MSQSRIEQLTSHFYKWEQRGRGWHLFSSPVELEPEFSPFFHYTPDARLKIDNGHRSGILEKIGTVVSKAFTSKPEPKAEPESEEVQAYQFHSDQSLSGFSISLPEGEKLTSQEFEKFLTMISYSNVHISFEIIASHTSIRIQFVCRESDILHVQSQLKAYFPACILQDTSNSLTQIVDDALYTYLCDLGLKEEFTRPIAMPERFDIDPLAGLYGVLEHLQEDERAVLQILFKGAVNPWAESIVRSVSDGSGDSFFLDAPEMPKLAADKASSPLFGVVIRVVGQCIGPEQAYSVLERVSNVLTQSSCSPYNSLIVLSGGGYDFEQYVRDVVQRQSHRGGMILNAKELTTFVHYPFSVASKKLERDLRKTKPAPRIAEGHGFILGKNIHEGVERIPTLETSQRLKHMHVIGATGTGKSTFLQSCIVQDVMLGNGVAVLDPHGDLIESILPYIPENRYNDVIIVDPSDSAYPVGFNILTAHSDVEKEILASDLVAVFRRLSSSFGDQMHSVLANAILAFVESSQGGSLIDLRRFLIERPFRDTFLKTVTDPSIVYYWQKEFPLLKSGSIGPILTRLDSFLRPKLIRNMVAQKKSLDFENILDTQKILFIKLSQGLIGTENSYLLGTFFVSKIYQAAMGRQLQSKADRKEFFLYVDEFQNFITPSMSAILSGTRKYGLGCILAHQDMPQLQKQDTELASAVVSNAGTRVCFRLGDIDAKRFEDGFSFFEASDLQNLGVGEAIARVERPEYDFNISTLELKEPNFEEETKERVISISREKYGRLSEEVENELQYLRDEVTHPEELYESSTKTTEPVKNQDVPKQLERSKLTATFTQIDEAQVVKTKEALVRQKELSQHRYLQMLIKKMAEARGYKATIEESILDGQGRIDVSLEKSGKKIACEIGVSTSKSWEAHNIEKCLIAGYDIVIAVANSSLSKRSMVKTLAEQWSSKGVQKVFVMEVNELAQYLDEKNYDKMNTEKRVKGYRIHLEYNDAAIDDLTQKQMTIAEILASKVKKLE